MDTETAIQWADHTFNANWSEPRKWDDEARATKERKRVFCASPADVFEDREDLDAPRSRLLETIEKTPHLDWLLLTKRPEKWRTCLERLAAVGVSDGDCLAEKWLDGEPLPNVWLGVPVEDQQLADERIAELLEIPARVRFLSMEPLIEHVCLIHSHVCRDVYMRSGL